LTFKAESFIIKEMKLKNGEDKMGLIVKRPETGTEDDIYGIETLINSYGLKLDKKTKENIKKANQEKEEK
jgi:hypothetical protein